MTIRLGQPESGHVDGRLKMQRNSRRIGILGCCLIAAASAVSCSADKRSDSDESIATKGEAITSTQARILGWTAKENIAPDRFVGVPKGRPG